MKYRITRSSDCVGEKPPCKQAIQMMNMGAKIWKIDIKSLQDLYELINEVGRIIIDDDSIEIYDDYRE